MTPRARVIALGQEAAGDDGVGLAVLAWLRACRPEGIELVHAADETELVELVQTPARVVVVDGVLATPAGEVLTLAVEELAAGPTLAVSTHGMGVGAAIALARTLAPATVAPTLRVVGVTIARPARYAPGLSAAVAAAVPRAGARVLALVGG